MFLVIIGFMTIQKHFRLAKQLARLLDSQFKIARFRFGLDPILGLIPEFGNMITTLASLYLFVVAYKLQVPSKIYIQMVWNIVVDSFITSVPILGNVADFFFKSNDRNLKLLSPFVDDEVLEGTVVS